ncbi:MAG: tetratricopeptide repeat protein [Candidatus Brocadiia bacterium]
MYLLPLVLACILGLVAAVVFYSWQAVRENLIVHWAYLSLLFVLWITFAGARHIRMTSGGMGLHVTLGALGGFLIMILCNIIALGYSADRLLRAAGSFLMGDTDIQTRKTYDRAEGAESHGDFKTAARLYREAIAEDPEDREARQRLARVLLKWGDAEGAAEELLKLLDMATEERERCTTALRLGEICTDELNDPDGAREMYEMILEEYPDSGYARHARARLERMDQS